MAANVNTTPQLDLIRRLDHATRRQHELMAEAARAKRSADFFNADTGRAVKYARAREDRSDTFADEIVSISDEAQVRVVMDGETERLELDSAAVARNRLLVDSRKWQNESPRVRASKGLWIAARTSSRPAI